MEENRYIYKNCVGCGACYETCPINALSFRDNENGYKRAIKLSNCIECGKCLEFCISSASIKRFLDRKDVPITYAAWSREKDNNGIGNSGGLFLALGKEYLKRGGVVAAVGYDENYVPRFFCATTIEELRKQAWSKFVQSETGTIFREVRQYLYAKVPVLFVGAPCQVKGLYTYLEGDNEYLLTVQFPCIGMPPQWFYQEYLKDFTGRDLSQIKAVYGEIIAENLDGRQMKCIMKNGDIVSEPAGKSLYVQAWNSFYCVDDVCCSCKDNIAPVCADLTWGNFWYLGELEKFSALHKKFMDGRSMLLVHSYKGEQILKEISEKIVMYKRSYREAETGHTMFQCPAEQHLLLRRYVKSKERKHFQMVWKEKNYAALKKEFFNKSNNSRRSFEIASNANKKAKALVWRLLYYIHKIKGHS